LVSYSSEEIQNSQETVAGRCLELDQCFSNFIPCTTGGPQVVSEEKALQKFYQTLNKLKIHPHMSAATVFVI
jgi:hypothetical protein